MAFFRKAVLASTMIAAGLASTTGAALANDNDNEGDKSLVNAQGTEALNQASACDLNAQILSVLPLNETEPNVAADALNKQGDGNAESRTPNSDDTCNPSSTSGSVDSSDAGTVDADSGETTRGDD